MKKKSLLLNSFLVIVFCLFTLTGCAQEQIPELPINVPTVVQTINAPTEVPSEIAINVPAGNQIQETGEAVIHQPVTAEDVKNVDPSLELGVNEKGEITGLPEGTTQIMIDNVKDFYDLAKERFPDSTIYYDQDVEGTRQFILYAISPDGKLQTSVVSYGEGEALQFNDYPIDFYDEETKEWKVNGEYTEVDIPGGTIGVVWKNGYPQFLAREMTLPNGDRIFANYLKYETYAGDDPWREISGVSNILFAPTETLAPLDKLTDISKDFTPEQIVIMEGLLKDSIGTWNENKRYDDKDKTWDVRVMSFGELINFQKSPLIISLSETEKMKVFEATNAYYLDSDGALQKMIVPLVAQMPDGKIFYFGPDGSYQFMNWTTDDDFAVKLAELRWVPGLKKGEVYDISFLTNIEAFINRFDDGLNTIRQHSNTNPMLYMFNWISKYNSYHSNDIQEMETTGEVTIP